MLIGSRYASVFLGLPVAVEVGDGSLLIEGLEYNQDGSVNMSGDINEDGSLMIQYQPEQ